MRRSSDNLTGGTKDFNPQVFKVTVTQSAADTFTSSTNPLPVQRLPNGRSAQVMEILKVAWFLTSAPAEVDNSITGFLTTKAYSSAPPTTDGPVIDHIRRNLLLTTSGEVFAEWPIVHDLTDGAGHGILIGTDNLYLHCGSSTTSLANTLVAWIYFRWKNVSLPEYIGMVQSQQN